MKKVKLTADLEIQSGSDNIIIKSDDENVWVNISSKSAVSFPLSTLLSLRQYIPQSRYLNQKITFIFSDTKTIKIENGKIHYLQKWFLFKFLLQVIVKNGI